MSTAIRTAEVRQRTSLSMNAASDAGVAGVGDELPGDGGMMYVRPITTMLGFCWSDGLAAISASRLALLFEPMSFDAMRERLSPTSALYWRDPAGTFAALAVGSFA